MDGEDARLLEGGLEQKHVLGLGWGWGGSSRGLLGLDLHCSKGFMFVCIIRAN